MRMVDYNTHNKCIRRSWLRRHAGKFFYRMCRRFQWLLGGRRYACRRKSGQLPFLYASHQTPLIRKLANVDMWMQRNKITNLRLAAGRLNEIVILPGETFSFWKAVGKPTMKKGYLPGMVLCDGRLKPGIGGGLCQLSNLIYWMTLHTPLNVMERHRHSYDVFPDAGRTQPFGSGATCSYNFLDLQIRNDTGSAFQLILTLNDDYLTGWWMSSEENNLYYDVYEKEHQIICNAWGGYIRHNAIWRRVYGADGGVLADEFITENDALMLYHPYLPGFTDNAAKA